MRFDDERYVRLYTRDTATWKKLTFGARSIFCLLLRVVDRAGILDVGEDAASSVAALIEAPPELVSRCLPELESHFVVTIRDGVLVIPRFIEAQECAKSDRLRALEYRERRRDAVTKRDVLGASVTARHTPSQGVTPSGPVQVPSGQVRSREENSEEIASAPMAARPRARRGSEKSPLPFRAIDACREVASQAPTRFVQGFTDHDLSALGVGILRGIEAKIRIYREREDWRRAGRFMERGPHGYRGTIGITFLANGHFAEMMIEARAWESSKEKPAATNFLAAPLRVEPSANHRPK